MTKKVIYKITKQKYEIIEVNTPEEEKIIEELKGTMADWRKIDISAGNEELEVTTRYYYSESKPNASGYWHYVNGKSTVWEFDE